MPTTTGASRQPLSDSVQRYALQSWQSRYYNEMSVEKIEGKIGYGQSQEKVMEW